MGLQIVPYPEGRPPLRGISDESSSVTTLLERALLGVSLCLSTVISLTLARTQVMDGDELFSFYTDSLPSASQVISAQLHFPISLDPPLYHLLSHAAMRVLGTNELALRLPAALAYLALQVVLYGIVRRMAGRRAGIVAATVLAFTTGFAYAGKGRPYALLLSLDAGSLLCWQLAKTATTSLRRTFARFALAACLLLAVYTHFFGLLILVPIALAEAVETYSRRRMDAPTAGVLLFAALSVLTLVPFSRALDPYRQHYYSSSVTWHYIPDSYAFMLLGYAHFSGQLHLPLIFTCAFLLLSVVFILRARAGKDRRPVPSPGMTAGIVTLAALPLFGYLLARWVSHTAEFRFAMPALVALSIMLATVLALWLSWLRPRAFFAVIGLLLAAEAWQGITAIRSARGQIPATQAWLRPEPSVKAFASANPDARFYTAYVGVLLFNRRYQPDPALRDRIDLLYDAQHELAYFGTDTGSIAASNLKQMQPWMPIGPLIDPPASSQVAAIAGTAWSSNWLVPTLRKEGFSSSTIGKGFAGEVLLLQRKGPP